MSSLKTINPNADVIGRSSALQVNISAAKSLASIVKTNLGPKGTLKMLVGGAGDIRLTKDGSVLLHQMSIQHPTAALIARTATAQDDITGDGTTSNVLFIGDLLQQAERYLNEGLHPRILVEGFEAALRETLDYLEKFKYSIEGKDFRDILLQVAKTSLRTKIQGFMKIGDSYNQQILLADHLAEICTDAVLCIRRPEKRIDLHMVEIMHMVHQSDSDTRLVKGLVLDHGVRHPDMPKRVENAKILIANVSLEYEKTEINSGLFYSSAEERQSLVKAERELVDKKVEQIIELKRKVCKNGEGFVLINQKGIDPVSLNMLAKENIAGIRRAKRRNMERLSLACGGYPINSTENLVPECLGHADLVYEHVLGEDKFTFVEGVQNPQSCTVLIKGPNSHTISQIKDAIRDGLRAILNTIEDNCVVPGAGAFEVAAKLHLTEFAKSVEGRAKLGVAAFADALMIIPKTLAVNSGHDSQEVRITLLENALKYGEQGKHVGLDIKTGGICIPSELGIWDNFRVKRQFLHLSTIISTKLLLVDEVMRAGKNMGGPPQGGPPQ